jgi:hypothetical protein
MQLKNSQYSAWGHAKHLVCSNESNEAFKVARSVGGTLEPGPTSGVQLFHRWAAQAQANPKYDNALVFICQYLDTGDYLSVFSTSCNFGTRFLAALRGVLSAHRATIRLSPAAEQTVSA